MVIVVMNQIAIWVYFLITVKGINSKTDVDLLKGNDSNT